MARMDPGSAREEAERLVATALAAARLATAGQRTAGPFATGGAECCVCPICRTIAALRDPSPELAERLSTGAGDLAAGVASLLRALVPPDGETPARGEAPPRGRSPGSATPFGTDSPSGSETRPGAGSPSTAETPSGGQTRSGMGREGTGRVAPEADWHDHDAVPMEDPDRVWRAATRTRHDAQPVVEGDIWAAATAAGQVDDDVRPME